MTARLSLYLQVGFALGAALMIADNIFGWLP